MLLGAGGFVDPAFELRVVVELVGLAELGFDGLARGAVLGIVGRVVFAAEPGREAPALLGLLLLGGFCAFRCVDGLAFIND